MNLRRGLGRGVIALADGHDELQMRIQAELEGGFIGDEHGPGQRLARRQRFGGGRGGRVQDEGMG
ncbi:MAG: hypothetical protein AAB466_09875 [Verrucomicrobiota bacterium]